MVKDSPSRSSMVVFARRTFSPQQVPWSNESSMDETSGLTTRLIRPSLRIVGVNASATPNCWNWTVMAELQFVLSTVQLLDDCETGIGNSPPARKLAVSPELA